MARARLERAANLLMNGGREAQLANQGLLPDLEACEPRAQEPAPFSGSGAGALGAGGETKATARVPVLAAAPHPRPDAHAHAPQGSRRRLASELPDVGILEIS